MKDLLETLTHRFGEAPRQPPEELVDVAALTRMARRKSDRRFKNKRVSVELLELLAAIALTSPTKSDLQQRDIIIVRSPEIRSRLDACVAEQTWIVNAPEMLIFCGNNRRQRQIHDWRNREFANDHLDAFFNAAVDAAIAMQKFVTAAEMAGLSCCPISAIRNESDQVSKILDLPDHVFAVAGLACGWPDGDKPISLRLPLSATIHVDKFSDSNIQQQISAYDERRHAVQPLQHQRNIEDFGEATPYTWSEDKTRQYAKPERAAFGAFVRSKGFCLD